MLRSNNRSYAFKQTCKFYLQANFTKTPFLSTRHSSSQDMPGVISPWPFKHGHFESPLVLDIFSTLSVKYKTSEISPKCYVTKSLTQRFNVNITTLCQWLCKLVVRVEPARLVIFHSTLTCQENGRMFIINLTTVIWKITKHKYE